MRVYDSRSLNDDGGGAPPPPKREWEHPPNPADFGVEPDPPSPPGAPRPKGLDRASFDKLYEREHRRLWLLSAGLTGRAPDADDVLQESMMLAFAKRASFRASGNLELDAPAFAAWVGRFVRNVAANHARGKRRQSRREAAGFDPGLLSRRENFHGPVEAAAVAGEVPPGQDAFDDRVLRALNRVKPVSRACLLMNVVGGLTQTEIATALGLRENTVASHIRRARERMRELLGGPRAAQPASQPPSSPAHQTEPDRLPRQAGEAPRGLPDVPPLR